MRDNPRWQYHLGEEDIADIDRALKVAKRSGQSISTLSIKNFPLNNLGNKLHEIGEELENGCGFVRIRGLPFQDWAMNDLELVWMGLACHIGQPVFQNPYGQLMREIRTEQGNVGHRYGQLETSDGPFLSSRARTASSAELRFHSDRCDIVGLLCTGEARRGGLSRIVSSVAVHNEMLKNDRKLCIELYKPLPRSRAGEEVGGETDWYFLPVWSERDGKFTSHYSRTYVEALEHIHGAPKVTETQWQAMDRLAELADRCALDMELKPGDIQFLNNHVIYHARTKYEDDPENGFVRHLIRIWLCAPHRALPENHRVLWREVDKGKQRGGVAQV